MFVNYNFFFYILGNFSYFYTFFNLYHFLSFKNRHKKFVLPKSPHVFKKKKTSYIFKKKQFVKIQVCMNFVSKTKLNFFLEKQLHFLCNLFLKKEGVDFFWVRSVQISKIKS